jgi:DNA-binding protein HU-beta
MEALIDETGRVEGVAAGTAVAAADIEVAVGTEVQVASVMVSRRVELGDERLLGLGVYLEGLDARQQETGDALVELTFNPKAVVDKDLLVFLILRVDGETEETALTGGIKLAVLRAELEDLRLDRLASGQAGDHLHLTAQEVAPLLLGLVRGAAGGRVTLLDHEDHIIASGQRRDGDREAELHVREGGFQGDDRVLSDGGSHPEKEREQEGGGRAETHGLGVCQIPKSEGGRMQKIFHREAGPGRNLHPALIFRWFSAHGSLLNTPASLHNQPTNNMSKALTKSQIAGAIAEKAEISKKQATAILEIIAALAYKNAKNSFTLPGLGKLVLVHRKARLGRNPATGETIQIKAKKVVKFRVAKAAKDAILGAK